jgi:hypothetical protein
VKQFASESKGRFIMEELIVIRALENGVWEIQLRTRQGSEEIIKGGKVCRIA